MTNATTTLTLTEISGRQYPVRLAFRAEGKSRSRQSITHIGEPAEPPRMSPARGPPAWDGPPVEPVPDWDALAQPQPEYVFDQEVQW
jgi:hypothetical protein